MGKAGPPKITGQECPYNNNVHSKLDAAISIKRRSARGGRGSSADSNEKRWNGEEESERARDPAKAQSLGFVTAKPSFQTGPRSLFSLPGAGVLGIPPLAGVLCVEKEEGGEEKTLSEDFQRKTPHP